ncbi:uncharacterized protein LOC125261535 isoform X3 [Megalobrama amblycephala]|uniref:uncharacterized protein LOC125261535 isoform X3 n=1 Tax=Megalobrama amblycephala TaxID=75352 RepID=UPI002014370A|nr:uncharacterized protein LOC125261535 isoform X3 [Megalobrama amblycephala]
MFLKQVTICLLFFTLFYLPHTDAESIRADEGATVHLPCHSPPDDSVQVSVVWTKHSATNKTICEWFSNQILGSSSDPSTVLHPGLSLQLLNSSNDTCVHLLCSLESLNPELVNFTWSREGQRSLHTSTSYDMKSELRLCKPDWSDGDTITCHASCSSAQTPLSRTITLDFSNEESSQKSPEFCVVLFSTFIICIIFIWMFFCFFKYKSVTCCSGPSA